MTTDTLLVKEASTANKYLKTINTGDISSDAALPLQVSGANEMSLDAWGTQRIARDYSLFHGIWTYDIPEKVWLEFSDGSEIAISQASSVSGGLQLESSTDDRRLSSKRHPRYQPNRGLKYSTACILNAATAGTGTLYAVIRKRNNSTGTTVDDRQEVTLPDGIDLSKGNVFDFQAQLRGVGNISFFINLEKIYTFEYLGTLTGLSISNYALPVSFECTDQGIIRFGMFNDYDGIFFEYEFDSVQETQLNVGCVDVTSEGGQIERKEFTPIASGIDSSIYATNNSGIGTVILAIRIPETLSYNTDTIPITRDSVFNRYIGVARGDEAIHKIYTMRNTTAFNSVFTSDGENKVGSLLEYIIGGTNSGGTENVAALQTAFEAQISNMELLTARRSEIDTEIIITNVDDNSPLTLTAGDYIFAVVTPDAGTDPVWSNFEFGDKI